MHAGTYGYMPAAGPALWYVCLHAYECHPKMNTEENPLPVLPDIIKQKLTAKFQEINQFI